jgi:hypothetical protein
MLNQTWMKATRPSRVSAATKVRSQPNTAPPDYGVEFVRIGRDLERSDLAIADLNESLGKVSQIDEQVGQGVGRGEGVAGGVATPSFAGAVQALASMTMRTVKTTNARNNGCDRKMGMLPTWLARPRDERRASSTVIGARSS